MNEQPLISVIIPVYNVEPFLSRCLDSVIRQSYRNLEIILIDDGSADASGAICDAYAQKDSRIRVIHQKNAGITGARNAGLAVCTGAYIAFVDSDDAILPDMYEKMLQACQTEAADLAVCGIGFANGLYRKTFCDTKKRIYDNRTLMESYLSKPYINHSVCNKLYAASVFKDLYFPTIARSEDIAFMPTALAGVQKAVYLNAPYYTQYLRTGSLERSAFGSRDLLILKAVRLRQNFIRKHYPDLYGYLKFEYAGYCMILLKRIAKQHAYRKNRKIYHNLLQAVQSEVSRIPDAERDWPEYKAYAFCLRHRNRFLLKNELYGYREDAKAFLKGICIKLKRCG